MSASHDRFSRAMETGGRMAGDWTALEKRIRAHLPGLVAASYDGEPGDGVVECEVHEREVRECRRLYELDQLDEFCTGVPLPRHTDPTGNGAARNRAYDDAGAFLGHARRAAHHIEEMARIASYYPTELVAGQMELVEKENERPDGCELCARVERWSPSRTAKPTDVGGVLEALLLLCTPHYDFVRTRGRLPSEDENRRHARTGRWPKIRQTERLAAGLRDGRLSA